MNKQFAHLSLGGAGKTAAPAKKPAKKGGKAAAKKAPAKKKRR